MKKQDPPTTAVIFPNELGIGVDVGWFSDHPRHPYCLVWGNFATRERATSALLNEYPDIHILQSNLVWQRIEQGSMVRLMPKNKIGREPPQK